MLPQMGANLEQLQLKKLLVDLEDEHDHLLASVNHLHSEIEKREIEVKKLLADSQLSKLTQETNQAYQPQPKLMKSQSVDFNEAQRRTTAGDTLQFNSSEFSKQVAYLLDKITKTSEEVSDLIKL